MLDDPKELAFDTDAEGPTVKVSPVSDDGECCHESSEALDFTAGMVRTFPEFTESQCVFSPDTGGLCKGVGVGFRLVSSNAEGNCNDNNASSSS